MKKRPKKVHPPEDSIFLRVLWFMLALNGLVMINMVDPHTASLSLDPIGIPLAVPLMVIYMWLGITGCFLSYQHRHTPKPWLVAIGLLVIAAVMAWFLDNLHGQFTSGMDVDILLPTVHLVAGLWIAHTFEMRTRTDFNFSLALSLMLIFMTSTIGKGLLFGFGLFVYIIIAGLMLLLDCESRTFGLVCARKIDSMDFSRSNIQSSERTGNLVFPIACTVALGVTLFVCVPRAESLADEVAASFFSMIKPDNQKVPDELPATVRKLQAPLALPESLSNRANGILQKAAQRQVQNARNKATRLPLNGQPDANAGTGKGAGTKGNANTKLSTKANETIPSDEQNRGNGNPPANRVPRKSGRGPVDKNAEQEPDTRSTSKQETPDKDLERTQEQSKVPPNEKGTKSGDTTGDQPKTPSKIDGSTRDKPPAGPKQKEKLLPEALDTRDPTPVSDEILFSVVCNRTVFFRKSVLDSFDGQRWYCSDPGERQGLIHRQSKVFYFPDKSIVSIPSTIPTTRFKQLYHFEYDCGGTLPLAGAPDLIEIGAPAMWIDVCGAVHSDWRLVPGAEYTAVSVLPMYNLQKLRQLDQLSPDMELRVQTTLANFLQIEKTLDPEVQDLAVKVAGKGGNWFVKAERISTFLKKNFAYDTGERHSRSTEDTLNHFLLETKAGDCKDFASAFVIMCRTIGIPCRFISGFNPGEFDAAAGKRILKRKHGHAWAEAYIPQGGWVPFDATPTGTLPERAMEGERYITAIKAQLEETLAHSGPSQPSSGQQTAQQLTNTPQKPKEPVSILAIMLALCFPGLLAYSGLMFWRSLTTKNLFVSTHPASKIYRRFLKNMKPLGIVVHASQTPGDIQLQIHQRVEAIQGNPDAKVSLLNHVDEFVKTYNETYFGSKGEVHRLKSLSAEVEQLLRKLR